MELVYAAAPAVTGGPLVAAEAIGLRMLGYLLWAAMAWRLIRHWQWHDRYWLAFNIVVALALPLVDRLVEEAPHWARVLYAHVGVTDLVARHVMGELSTGLLATIIVSAPMAWLLWQHVVVHRRGIATPSSVDAPAPGA